MTLPVTDVIYPTDLTHESNGELSQTLLTLCGFGNFKMHHLASRALRAMVADYDDECDALETYRVYSAQVTGFDGTNPVNWDNPYVGRYVPENLWATYADTGRKFFTNPVDIRNWNNKRWKRRNGTAMSAVPGTSNHGWALAIDFKSITLKFVEWLKINAYRFGFSAEAQSENWHWRYFAGDNLPQAVIDYEQGPISEDDEMLYRAVLDNGDQVVVGASVRPISQGEPEIYKDLPVYTPTPGSLWHNWLRAGHTEYSNRVGQYLS